MDNIIRLDPDVVIAPSPTPFETTNRINTIKLRIYIYIYYVNLSCADRCNGFAYKLSSLFLSFFLYIFAPSSSSLVHSLTRRHTVYKGRGRGKHVYTRREASWWRAIKKQFSASSRERAFTTRRVRDDKASFVWNSNYVLNLSWRGKSWWRWYEKLIKIDQLWFKE